MQCGVYSYNEDISPKETHFAISGVGGELSLKCGAAVQVFSPGVVRRLQSIRPLQEGSDGAEVSLVAEEVGVHLALAPVVDGEGDGVEADWAVPEEESPEVDPLDLVQHGVQARDLPDVVTDDVQQAAGDVCLGERWRLMGIFSQLNNDK